MEFAYDVCEYCGCDTMCLFRSEFRDGLHWSFCFQCIDRAFVSTEARLCTRSPDGIRKRILTAMDGDVGSYIFYDWRCDGCNDKLIRTIDFRSTNMMDNSMCYDCFRVLRELHPSDDKEWASWLLNADGRCDTR